MRFASFAAAAPVIEAHERKLAALERRLRHVEKQLDTLGSPWWKRALFRLDGWPAWHAVAQQRAWRPWHKRQ